jgi:hypothetical protein
MRNELLDESTSMLSGGGPGRRTVRYSTNGTSSSLLATYRLRNVLSKHRAGRRAAAVVLAITDHGIVCTKDYVDGGLVGILRFMIIKPNN